MTDGALRYHDALDDSITLVVFIVMRFLFLSFLV